MARYISFIIFTFLISSVYAQNHFMITGNIDLIKTDIQKFFGKTQSSGELHYFVAKQTSLSIGYEARTAENNFLTLGMRKYILSFVFIRGRALWYNDRIDFSIAPGYKYFLTRRWRAEVMPEFYFNKPQFAIRFGLGYVFTK